MSGVQFKNTGQLDTLNAPLTFLNTVNGNLTSKVSEVAFLNCMSNCLRVKNAHNITFENNIMYDVAVFGAQIS